MTPTPLTPKPPTPAPFSAPASAFVAVLYRPTISRSETTLYFDASTPRGATVILATTAVSVPMAFFTVTGPGAANVDRMLIVTPTFRIFLKYTTSYPSQQFVRFTTTSSAALTTLSLSKYGAKPAAALTDYAVSMPSCYQIGATAVRASCPTNRRREAADADTLLGSAVEVSRKDVHRATATDRAPVVMSAAVVCAAGLVGALVFIIRRRSAADQPVEVLSAVVSE
jgi:hypothetical protein